MIDIQEKEDTTSNHPKGAATDTTLVEMLIHGIKAGKITAYSNADRTMPLTVADIDHMIIAAPDTVTILDPVNGGEQTMVVTHDFDYGAIHKYRILEEWAYNPATANTNIHIAGIAPVRDIYGSDGSFRGVQAMFWVHYTDIQDVLTRYAQHHPDNNLVAGIWNDYFLNNEKQNNKTTGAEYKKEAVRIITIGEPEDTVIHHLRDMDADDTTLMSMIIIALKSGTIHRDSVMEQKFTDEFSTEIFWRKPDTTTIVDPVSGKEITKVVAHELEDYQSIKKYGLLENWVFNTATGNTNIQIVGIAPLMGFHSNDSGYKYEAIFWLRYDDAKPTITYYEHKQHSSNTFATKIWNNYFYSDVRPTGVK